MFGSIKAIVFYNQIYGNIDRIYHVFSDKLGKIPIILRRGSLPKNPETGILDSINYVQILVFHDELTDRFYIQESDLINDFKPAKYLLPKTLLIYYFLHVLDRLFDQNNPENKVFKLLLQLLKILNSSREIDPILVKDIFLWHICRNLGYLPELEKCSKCSSPNIQHKEIGFSYEFGGIVCADCMDSHLELKKISPGSFKFLRKILNSKVSELLSLRYTALAQKELEGISENFLKYHTDRDFLPYKRFVSGYKFN